MEKFVGFHVLNWFMQLSMLEFKEQAPGYVYSGAVMYSRGLEYKEIYSRAKIDVYGSQKLSNKIGHFFNE